MFYWQALDDGWHERTCEGVDALMELVHGLALARGVVQGRPAGVDLGEVRLEALGGSRTRVETCTRLNGGVPLCDAYEEEERVG